MLAQHTQPWQPISEKSPHMTGHMRYMRYSLYGAARARMEHAHSSSSCGLCSLMGIWLRHLSKTCVMTAAVAAHTKLMGRHLTMIAASAQGEQGILLPGR